MENQTRYINEGDNYEDKNFIEFIETTFRYLNKNSSYRILPVSNGIVVGLFEDPQARTPYSVLHIGQINTKSQIPSSRLEKICKE